MLRVKSLLDSSVDIFQTLLQWESQLFSKKSRVKTLPAGRETIDIIHSMSL
jgi:hypothetical protein